MIEPHSSKTLALTRKARDPRCRGCPWVLVQLFWLCPPGAGGNPQPASPQRTQDGGKTTSSPQGGDFPFGFRPQPWATPTPSPHRPRPRGAPRALTAAPAEALPQELPAGEVLQPEAAGDPLAHRPLARAGGAQHHSPQHLGGHLPAGQPPPLVPPFPPPKKINLSPHAASPEGGCGAGKGARRGAASPPPTTGPRMPGSPAKWRVNEGGEPSRAVPSRSPAARTHQHGARGGGTAAPSGRPLGLGTLGLVVLQPPPPYRRGRVGLGAASWNRGDNGESGGNGESTAGRPLGACGVRW